MKYLLVILLFIVGCADNSELIVSTEKESDIISRLEAEANSTLKSITKLGGKV